MSAVSPLEMVRAVGAAPVAGNAAAGLPINDLPDYTDITDEIARLNLSGRRAVNWSNVVAKSESLLRTHSKNLRVAAYLAYGLYETNGLRGLATGLGLIGDMVANFWADCQPPRPRGRLMALDWLAENVRAGLDKDDAHTSETVADCEAALSEAEWLQANLTARSSAAGDAAWPLLPALKSRLEKARLAEQQAQAEPEAPGEPEAPASVRPNPVPSASALDLPANLTTPEARERALGSVRSSLLRFATGLRSADMADPRAYILQRAAVWLPLRVLPPTVNGETELPCPPREVQAEIEAALTAQEYATAVGQCEDALTDSLFWLDGHRLSAEALSALGHTDAAQAVRAETLALLHRLPNLVELKFNDGTPFANPATRRWLGSDSTDPTDLR